MAVHLTYHGVLEYDISLSFHGGCYIIAQFVDCIHFYHLPIHFFWEPNIMTCSLPLDVFMYSQQSTVSGEVEENKRRAGSRYYFLFASCNAV